MKSRAPNPKMSVENLPSRMPVHFIGHGNPMNAIEDNEPFALDWALEASDLFKELIGKDDHAALIDYPTLGRSVKLAVPTPEHYLPLLYALALKEDDESVAFFNDLPVAGSLTMTSLVIDKAP